MPRPPFCFDEQAIRQWHSEGKTAREISNILGCAEQTLLKFTVGIGLRFKRRGRPGGRIELTGHKVGKLTVKEPTEHRDAREVLWRCECECGKTAFVRSGALSRKKNPVRSCGCLRGEAKKFQHGGAYKLITSSYWHSLANGAMRRQMDFAVAKEEAWEQYESQAMTCALSGRPIELVSTSERMRGKQTASLDRKDSAAGMCLGTSSGSTKSSTLCAELCPKTSLSIGAEP
jgi:hypothetical protein